LLIPSDSRDDLNNTSGEAEQFIQSALNALSAHIAILDEAGNIIAVNSSWQRFAETNNYTHPNYGIGTNYLAVCDASAARNSEDAPIVAKGIRDIINGNIEEFQLEYPCHSPTQKRWFVVRISRFQWYEHRRVIVAHQNISELKRVQIELSESKRRTEAIIDNVNNGIITLNSDACIETANHAAARIFGYPLEELLGLHIEHLIADTFANESDLLRLSGQYGHEIIGIRKDKQKFPMYLSLCINLDLVREPRQTERLACDVSRYAEAMRTIGRHMRPDALVVVESTLPLGASDRVLYPALRDGLVERGYAEPPLYAFCYERVMPGPNYLDSVNNYWRAYAGIDEPSAERAEAFLRTFVDVERFPLWRHKTTRAAEMAKLMENAYRATNIAFIDEWCRIAERSGVDLFDVVDSIRVRKGTHDNMMYPGLGVGGYCLTKDALLAAFGAEELLGLEAELPFSRSAILTNERMPLRALEMLREHFGGRLEGRRVLLLGVTYRPDVADTRSSPAEVLARALLAERALGSAC
jgi:PAS domain S-box-containing protein